MRFFLAAVLLAWSTGVALAADPTGVWQISGTSPGGSTYHGTATVQANGQTYSVTWRVGNSSYAGVGILSGNAFATYYQNASDAGVILYQATGSNWNGLWAHGKGGAVGTEVWRR